MRPDDLWHARAQYVGGRTLPCTIDGPRFEQGRNGALRCQQTVLKMFKQGCANLALARSGAPTATHL